MTYSQEELREMLVRMRAVSATFYSGATHTGCHTFIEFCGLMNEYIKVCEQSRAAGVDFTEASTHGGGKLVVHPYNMQYLAEKFTCIFETTLQDPEMLSIFLAAVSKKTGHEISVAGTPGLEPGTTESESAVITNFTTSQ